VECVLKVDEETVITGSSDGLLRVVQLLPNKLLGVLGDHEGFPVEGLEWGAGGTIGSYSHDEVVRLWDGGVFTDDGEGEAEAEAGEAVDVVETMREKGVGLAGAGSDDEWEDMDEEDEEDDEEGGEKMDGIDEGDSDDSDMDDDDEEGGGGKKFAKLQTPNEAFFEDL
jgi:hypothetical protein